MSEWLGNDNQHLENLRMYCKGVLDEDDPGTIYAEYEEDIKTVRPEEVMKVVDWMVSCGQYDMETVKNALNKIINIFATYLEENVFDLSRGVPQLITVFADENRAVTSHMERIKEQLKTFSRSETGSQDYENARKDLITLIKELAAIDRHYIKMENILFPLVEKYIPEYRCLHVMWSIHDDVRKGIKNIISILSEPETDGIRFNRAVGRLFFDIYGMIFREDFILLPMSARKIPAEELDPAVLQCGETGYCFIDAPEIKSHIPEKTAIPEGNVDLGTGTLSAKELLVMFNTLPVDITYVDADDRVKYFSSPQERIFPRSKAIIGRSVQNCHPQESVHIVNKVVERLKSGRKNVENFWIQMNGRFILIQYFALRDTDGTYMGSIEVSQDVTDIRQLNGEKRLLDMGS